MDRRTLLKVMMNGIVMHVVPLKIAKAYTDKGRRLILVELSGANDGLNTVVPISDHRYRELRPNIGLKTSEVFDIGGGFALHSAIKSLDHMWQDGELAIVGGCGSRRNSRQSPGLGRARRRRHAVHYGLSLGI